MSKKYRFSKKDFEIIENWINENIDIDIQVEKSYRFECDTEEEIVYLSNKRWNKQDNYFDIWYKKQDFYTPMNYTLICILHEIGHIMTKDMDLLEQGFTLNEIYHFMYDMGSITEEELNFAYFDIPSEKLATQWGVQYYIENKQKCEELAEMVGLNQFNRA